MVGGPLERSGTGRVPSERCGTGRGTLGEVRDRLEDPQGGLGWVAGPYCEGQDGSGDPPEGPGRVGRH